MSRQQLLHLAADLSFIHTDHLWRTDWLVDRLPVLRADFYEEVARIAARGVMDMLFFGDAAETPEIYGGESCCSREARRALAKARHDADDSGHVAGSPWDRFWLDDVNHLSSSISRREGSLARLTTSQAGASLGTQLPQPTKTRPQIGAMTRWCWRGTGTTARASIFKSCKTSGELSSPTRS